jgi:hypothetical protein
MPTSQKKGPAIARVTFIRHQATIEKEFRDGWSALAIYERHKEELSTISYRQFLRYVSAWRQPPLADTPARAKPERPQQKQPAPAPSDPPEGSLPGRSWAESSLIGHTPSVKKPPPEPIPAAQPDPDRVKREMDRLLGNKPLPEPDGD